MERVVVTGMGALSPFGDTAHDLWSGLIAGRCGIQPLPEFAAAGLPVTAGGRVAALPAHDRQRDVEMSRRPIADALAHAGLPAAAAGIVWSTGLDTVVHQEGAVVARGAGDCFAAIAAPFGGPRRMVATACASATQAIGEAFHLVRSGRLSACVAGGGTTMLTPFYVMGFSWLQAVALDEDHRYQTAGAFPGGEDLTRACRPFDRARRGFALAEGGAALVLESWTSARSRGVMPLAEVRGFGVSQDGYDLNRPPPGGEGAELCMRRALRDAGLEPAEIGAVNAHGTGTRAGDPAEVAALRRLLGSTWSTTPVSSMKGALGHAMAASGALEAVAAVGTCQTGIVPPTCNLVQADDDCQLDHVMVHARATSASTVLSSSFGMGGQNAAVVFARAPEAWRC